jgi:midasin
LSRNTEADKFFSHTVEARWLDSASALFGTCSEKLEAETAKHPAVDAILLPIIAISTDASLAINETIVTSPESIVSTDVIWQQSDSLVEDLLLSAQQLVKLNVEGKPDDDGPKVMARLEMFTRNMSGAFRMDAVARRVQAIHDVATTGGFVSTSGAVLDVNIARCLPFLKQHLAACRKSVWHLARNVKGLYKLDYTLVKLFRTLAEKGFCKPSETDNGESKGGEGQEIDGMGIGAGTGESNISNQIEDESQVEGLKDEDQGQDEEDSGEKQEKEEQAIEMGDDFDGALSDADEGSDDEDGDDDDEKQDENDLDDHVGDVDPEAVDDKFWGDENDEEDPGTDDKTDQKDSNQNQDSEMAAKEDDKKKPGKESAPEQPDDNNAEEEEVEDEGKRSDDGIDEDEGDDGPNQEEAPQDDNSRDVDAHVPEAEILDLPEGMDLDQDGDIEEEGEDEAGSQGEDAPSEAGSDLDDANAAGSEIDDGDAEENQHVDAGPDENSALEDADNETEQGQGESGVGDQGKDGQANSSTVPETGLDQDEEQDREKADGNEAERSEPRPEQS